MNFTTNFISPTDAGLTIDNQQYLLYPNSSTIINNTKGYNYTLSVELANISITPIQHTIALVVKSQPNTINITTENFTGNILANQTLSVQNLTSSSLVPSIPIGYDKQLVQNISVVQRATTPNPKINTTIYAQIKYNCSIPFYEEVPLILSNYSWTQISLFTVKPNDCIVTFSFGSDPVLALTKYMGASNKTTTTIPASSTTIEYVPPISLTTSKSKGIHIPNLMFVPVMVMIILPIVTSTAAPMWLIWPLLFFMIRKENRKNKLKNGHHTKIGESKQISQKGKRKEKKTPKVRSKHISTKSHRKS